MLAPRRVMPSNCLIEQPLTGAAMSSIAKVIEVIAESDKSWDDAVKNALTEAAKTVDDIKEIWVSSMKAIVENNKVVRYRLTAKITFVLKAKR
jgi:flavin-binding protein dodecin